MNNWDQYYFSICEVLSNNSKCFSRKIGAILVRDKSIISTGYNGPPRGVARCDERYILDKNLRNEFIRRGFDVEDSSFFTGKCPRRVLGYKSGEGLQYCNSGHAERNSLINAARNGINTKGTILYANCPIPCTPCLVEIINAGVEEIVIEKLEYYDESGEFLIQNSGIKLRKFNLG